jgi:flavorubredoxin
MVNNDSITNNERGHIANAAVIFDTRYRNTEKIAKSLETGLKQSNILTVCVNAEYVTIHDQSHISHRCIAINCSIK